MLAGVGVEKVTVINRQRYSLSMLEGRVPAHVFLDFHCRRPANYDEATRSFGSIVLLLPSGRSSENHLLRLIEKLNGAVKNFIGRDGGLCPALRTSFCGDLLYVKLFWSRQSQNHENPNGGKRRDSNPRPRKNVTSGWSLALIGNPSAQKFPGRRTGPEAFR